MLDPQNLVNLSGGLVAEPELINDRILKLRLAIDYAGSEKDSDNKSGYFDIVYYLKDNNGFTSKNASFVSTQVSEGKMKKGTSLSIIGRLVQERWKEDDKSRSKIVVVAEHMTYGQRSASSGSGSPKAAEAKEATAAASIPQSF